MGKITGFKDFSRSPCPSRPAAERVGDWAPFHDALPSRERRIQAGRCMNCGAPFCQSGIVFEGARIGCPLHNLIPEWNDLLWQGRPVQAVERLLQTNCFPEFTGRVCPALCEDGCTLGQIGESVTVRENELSLIEYAFSHGLMTPAPPASRSGHRVAVVGSGPAGLAAAYWLNRRSHSVTVLERDEEPGGLLRYGIPPMKLPRDILARRISLMEAEGIVFETGVQVGAAVSPEALLAEYDCVIFCCGAQQPRKVNFQGEAKGVGYALDYLRDPSGALNAQDRDVIVVGAGNSASDCIATALRQGARSVVQLIRKDASFYPGAADYAHEEAEAVFGRDIRLFSSQLRAVHAGEDGNLTSITAATPEGEQELPAGRLIIASGFTGTDAGFAVPDAPNVFVAGDMQNGSSLVVLAIADGKRAAARAERYLLGYTGIL